ncbi:hypothetical protein D3C78_1846660 [compost metagenome]
MRIEEGQRQTNSERLPQARLLPLSHRKRFGGTQRRMQAFCAIPDEEGGPRITHDGIERRHDGADPLKTKHADGDEQRI